MGPHVTRGTGLRSGDDDQASRCDEFVNPRYAELDGCTAADRGDGPGAAVGYVSTTGRADSAARGACSPSSIGSAFEVEHIYHEARLDETSSILDPFGTTFARTFGSELP